MTREEIKKQKLKEEKEFIESIKGKAITGKEKGKFRLTSVWKKFREQFKGKCDPITLKPVRKGYQLHHLSLDPKLYSDLTKSHYIPLSPQCHEYIHWLYGYYRHDKKILTRIKKVLDKMVELNDGRDVRDFMPKKPVVKKTKSVRLKSKIKIEDFDKDVES